ncbi:MAG: sodium:calcium antiporter [Candidatus Melainabacteria bacterium]|nr:MAG: sodium:calcium antiporter [Candidatus Melainabacteria bacterium]
MFIWIEFLVCAGVILYSGSRLSIYGDLIADKTGLGKSWVGLVLLATVTSLPELITGVSAVTLNDLPDMAVSGTIGSCMFNMMVIALLDFLSKKRPVSDLVHDGHMLSCGFGIVLLGLVAIDIGFGKFFPVLTKLNSIDPVSLIFIAVYLLSMRLIYDYEKSRINEFAGEIAESSEGIKTSLKKAITMFIVNSVVIITAACFLPELGEQIAKQTGWGESFVGSSFIAITTSLPEITVSFTAARMGSFDMAVANLLGSNLFNVAILAVTDLCYVKAPLLRSVSAVNSSTAICAMIALSIVVIGLTYRSKKKFLFLAGDAMAIAVVYIIANAILFLAR